MKNENMVFYAETNAIIKVKIYHQKRSALYKRNKRQGIGWCQDYGNIPTGVFNSETKQFEPAINRRGLAYAHRNRAMYKKNKRYE